VRCGSCGADNSDNAHYCGTCGFPLSASPDQVLGDPSPATVCAYCGAQGDLSGGVCASCGAHAGSGLPGLDLDSPPPYTATPEDAARSLPSRDLGSIIGETIRIYRGKPLLYLSIGMVPQLPGLAGLATQELALEITLSIVGIALLPIAQGALVFAVAGGYAGLPLSTGNCLARARFKAIPLLMCWGILIALLILSGLLSTILIGIPMFFLALVLLWFYPQAIMVERRTPMEAFRRSITLVQGNWWRCFGTGAAYFTPILVITALVFALADNPGGIWVAIVSILTGVVGIPWLMIGSTLFYFDLRIRKEGFDLHGLRQDLDATTHRT